MSSASPSLADYVDALQASGKYTFTRRLAQADLGVSDAAFQSAARRLAAKRRIASPRRGFFVVVPLEYRTAGAPPASWFIDALMEFEQHPYYVGLLSAAAIHGAAHQQPQELQVVTDTRLRPLHAGRARVRFFLKRGLARTPTTRVKTETGTMSVSTPEATVFDLVRYRHGAGHLSNVATVLAELWERIDAQRLVEAATALGEIASVQRAGWLLERVGAHGVTGALHKWIDARSPPPIPLTHGRRHRQAALDPRWGLVINDEVEPDI